MARRPTYRELAAENAQLRQIVSQQKQQLKAQALRIASLEKILEELREQVETLSRREKRQAAPFSKGAPKENPAPPGRKAGNDYGTKGHREPPTPEQITETYEVPLPTTCPHCHSPAVEETPGDVQYQVELPQAPIYRQFNLHLGQCRVCLKRVQGRHRLQTSDALGAARSQLGPVLQAFLAVLQKQLGLSHGKCVKLLQTVWNIRLTRGGVVHSLQRLARRLAPTVQRIRQAIRASPEVAVDETGWRIGGRSAWLHTQVTDRWVHYAIARTRSAEVSAEVLGWDYSGVLVHDGFSSYNHFVQARHQQCLAHILRRCQNLLEWLPRRSADMVQWLKAQLQEALTQRERLRERPHLRLTLSSWVALQQMDLVDHLRRWRPHLQPLRRLRRFLLDYRGSLFTFLLRGSAATSWRAEQAIRPAVVNRKVWGGNRTAKGAQVQSSLMSVIETLDRQRQLVIDQLVHTLCTQPAPLRNAA